ncbi:MAG: hypothetical protein V5A44_02640 [Haloarculaceae archaeon]
MSEDTPDDVAGPDATPGDTDRDEHPGGGDADDARVCLVATRPETFERCRDGCYPSPRSYDRTTAPFEYLGFYRTAPVSAVTHYARVTDRVEQDRGGPGPMDGEDWAATIDPFSETDRVVVFELGDLVALAEPVENDRSGVRGAWYCALGELRAADRLSELVERDGPG